MYHLPDMEETVNKILRAQETRAQLYKELEDALNANQEKKIGLEQMGIIVQLVTEGLNEVSSDIRNYQASLTKELKLLVDSLQEKERSKLQATVKLEQLKVVSTNSPVENTQISELEARLSSLSKEINDILQNMKDEI
nr:uncharacterized protein SPAC4H3.06 [Schizosaccharomyces pombe]Q10214.1 RecName: Full=Uncharacterized protein C4H3.06 [Schizosaccharomyces pombe 972h-]CAA93345.3 sequence orphan [Schizosaccharomyces pombe]|eukprot:NP_594342.3 uncharacterized protein SPAC4H3.06 [Schizosaccharomyces pombe]